MKALLVAAGLGTRLRPITNTIPKCLVPINGVALLDIWLESLSNFGIDSFLINAHHLANKVNDHIAASPYKEKINLVYEGRLLGTAGTLRSNLDFFNNQDGFFAHADNYCLADFKEFLTVHKNRPKGCLLTMMVFETNEPEKCGIVELDNQGVVLNFYEKILNPPGNLANGAIYLLSSEFLKTFKNQFKNSKDFSLDVIPHFMGKIYTYKTKAKIVDIGTITNYNELNNSL